MHTGINHTLLGIHGIFAVAGGFMRALMDKKQGWVNILVSTVIAGFAGTIFGMLAMSYYGDTHPYFTLSIAGAGGLIGEKGVFYLADTLKDFGRRLFTGPSDKK